MEIEYFNGQEVEKYKLYNEMSARMPKYNDLVRYFVTLCTYRMHEHLKKVNEMILFH